MSGGTTKVEPSWASVHSLDCRLIINWAPGPDAQGRSPHQVILDVASGSMTTAIACILERRRFLCIERYKPHYVFGVRRVRDLLNSMVKEAAD